MMSLKYMISPGSSRKTQQFLQKKHSLRKLGHRLPLIIETSLAPSPIARVTASLCFFTSSTTRAFCRGVTRQQITAVQCSATPVHVYIDPVQCSATPVHVYIDSVQCSATPVHVRSSEYPTMAGRINLTHQIKLVKVNLKNLKENPKKLKKIFWFLMSSSEKLNMLIL